MQLCEVKFSKLITQKPKKAWSPGQFWAAGKTRNIKFTLHGLNYDYIHRQTLVFSLTSELLKKALGNT